MKTVKTKADLTRFAVSRGAVAKMADGGLVNAGRMKASIKRPTPPAPKELPAPKPAEIPDNTGVSDAVRALAEQQVALTKAIADHITRVPPKCGYEFDITRDADGFMKRVVATPT
jgi:hypothetical protein